jgi:hypothetical protein
MRRGFTNASAVGAVALGVLTNCPQDSLIAWRRSGEFPSWQAYIPPVPDRISKLKRTRP